MASYLDCTDLFCGAGGSSTGATNAGVEVKMALNHWPLAIETHNTNHPQTDHDCTDIQACEPRYYPSTDILIGSPECTNHSLAKGQKRKFQNQYKLFGSAGINPANEKSRATMWDIPRFAEVHNYKIVIVENVVDARRWSMFDAWRMAMDALGYNHKCCYFNSMFFGTCPQSRDRMYVVFWKKGNPEPDLEFRPKGYCPKCEADRETYQWFKKPNKKWGKYNAQYLYRCSECTKIVTPYYHAAFNVIDWSEPGVRIRDRKKKLAANTIKRIKYGLEKYGNNPMVITTRYTSGIDCRVRNATTDSLPTQPSDNSHGICIPFFVNAEHSKSAIQNRVKSGLEALGTQTTTQSTGVVIPQLLVGNYTPGWTRPTMRTTGTVTTDDHHGVLSWPIGKMETTFSNNTLNNINSSGVLTQERFAAFLTYYYGGSLGASSIEDKIGTITTKDRVGLVVSTNNIKLEDCFYRMLKAHEVKRAMAFDDDYVILGNQREQVKQCGNAVTPPVMEFITKRCVASLEK